MGRDHGAPLPKGTFASMNAVLNKSKNGKEVRTDFVREAVKREIARRERAKGRPRRREA